MKMRSTRTSALFGIAAILAAVAAFEAVSASHSRAEGRDSGAAAARALRNEEYFEALIEKLRAAREEIAISMYLFTAGDRDYRGKWPMGDRVDPVLEVKRRLIEASRRGVKVSILLEMGDDSPVAEENNRAADDLRREGLAVKFDSRGKVTHTKLVVIDSRYLFVGSHNLTRSALSRNNEFSLMVDSPKLARAALDYINKLGRWE